MTMLAMGTHGRLAVGVLVMLGAFAGVIVALHVLRPDCDPGVRHLSEYAVGRCGALMVVAFLLAGTAVGLLAAAFWKSVWHSTPLRVGCVLLVAAAAANGLMAAFVTDLSIPGAGGTLEVTRAGRVHDVLATLHAGFWLPIPPVLVIAIRRDERWRRFVIPATIAAAVELAGVVVVVSLQRWLPGLGQRIWIAVLVGWCAVQAFMLLAVEKGGAGRAQLRAESDASSKKKCTGDRW